MITNFEQLEKIIGYTFNNKELLKKAMTHTSAANEMRIGHLGSNERFEFLGDSILQLISADYVFHNHPDMTEGELSKLRSKLVCEKALDYDAKKINLNNFVILGKGEEATGGRMRASVISDAMESLIAAIYLDSSFKEAKIFVEKFILNEEEIIDLCMDYKTKLLEIIQSMNEPNYKFKLASETGPDHNKKFEVDFILNGKTIGKGIGKSKKEAEQQAAKMAVQTF